MLGLQAIVSSSDVDGGNSGEVHDVWDGVDRTIACARSKDFIWLSAMRQGVSRVGRLGGKAGKMHAVPSDCDGPRTRVNGHS